MRKTRSGFTLVEVAVALAIFVIGAIAIIRIFPSALGAISGSGDRRVAVRLDRDTDQRLSSEPEIVPSAVYEPSNFDTVNTNNFDGAFVGTRNSNNALPQGTESTSSDSLSHFRYIVGEHHVVQTRRLDNTAIPATEQFILTHFPIASGAVRIFVEGNVNGVSVLKDDPATLQTNEDGMLDFSGATENNADFSDTTQLPIRYLPRNDKRDNTTYYVTYRWRDASGHINGVVDESITIPANSATFPSIVTPSAFVLQARRSSARFFKQIVSVRYRQELLPATYTASSSPLQSSLGYIRVTGLNAGDKISVDYSADWGTLLENTQPYFNGNTRSVSQLSVRNLDDASQFAFASLYLTPGISGQNTWTFATFAKADNTGTVRQPATSPGIVQTGVNETSLKAGRLVFDATTPATPSSGAPQARISYKTLNRWTHQLSVAASSYVPFYRSSEIPNTDNPPQYTPGNLQPRFNPRERWREYVLGENNSGNRDGYLYFQSSEAGKTVLVSFEYDPTPALPNNNDNRVVTGQVTTISDRTIGASSAPIGTSGFSTGQYLARALLTDEKGNAVMPIAITAVQGASVQVRTAWLDGNKFTQTVLSGYRPLEGNS